MQCLNLLAESDDQLNQHDLVVHVSGKVKNVMMHSYIMLADSCVPSQCEGWGVVRL